MEWLIVVVAVVVLYFFSKGKSQPNKKNKQSLPSNPVSKNTVESIRKGFQIFVPNISIEGIQFRKSEATRFIDDSNQQLSLQAEPTNEVDKNAIKIIGEGSKGRYHLGYVSKDIALKLASTNCLPFVYARLIRTYRSETNFIDITYQIVGKKDKKEQFDSYELNLPITNSQKTYLKFWQIKYEDNFIRLTANKLISEHREDAQKSKPEKWLEWQRVECISDIYDFFSDKEEREQFDIKKPTKKQIEAVIDALLAEGVKLDTVRDEYQIFVDKLTELYPQLES